MSRSLSRSQCATGLKSLPLKWAERLKSAIMLDEWENQQQGVKPMMLWLIAALVLALNPSEGAQVLTENEPIIGKVGANAKLKFRLLVPAGQRGVVTLIPLDGDADLFVLPAPDTSILQTPFKSTNPSLQVERVILPVRQKETQVTVCVAGLTETQFVLSVRWTKYRFASEPARTFLVDVQWQEIAFSNEVALGALTIANKTNTWYEVNVKAVGVDERKVSLPSSFVLGPKGQRYFGWVELMPNSRLKVTFRRTPKADAFLVADCVSRLVAGVAISPEIDIAIDDLMPKLQPLLSIAQPLREGDWKRAGTILVTTLKRSPQTLTALQEFLKRTGVRLPRDVFGSRIASGFGAISAIISAMSAINLPKQEQVTLTLQPVEVKVLPKERG